MQKLLTCSWAGAVRAPVWRAGGAIYSRMRLGRGSNAKTARVHLGGSGIAPPFRGRGAGAVGGEGRGVTI